MTDKERIEVYVNELPRKCKDCPCMNDDSYGTYDCTLYYKLNDRILSCDPYENGRPKECPLKTIQSVQNRKAISALQEVKAHITKDVDYKDELERRGDLSEYGKGGASRNIIIIAYIDQLIKSLKEEDNGV